jgi:hypothetical protein
LLTGDTKALSVHHAKSKARPKVKAKAKVKSKGKGKGKGRSKSIFEGSSDDDTASGMGSPVSTMSRSVQETLTKHFSFSQTHLVLIQNHPFHFFLFFFVVCQHHRIITAFIFTDPSRINTEPPFSFFLDHAGAPVVVLVRPTLLPELVGHSRRRKRGPPRNLHHRTTNVRPVCVWVLMC